jgi:hypothetical protein
MDQAGRRNRQRTLRHAAPERVRELLHAYRRRAARDLPAASRRGSGIDTSRLASDTSSGAVRRGGERA